jgi:hypothetical protein
VEPEPFRTFVDNLGNIRVGFYVVYNCRLAEQSLYGRERRTGTRLASVAYNGGKQSGFLAADEGACAESQVYVKVKSGVKYVFAKQIVALPGQ